MIASPLAPPVAATMKRRIRYWPAILALYFLAPVCGEMLEGSTPLPLFIQPFNLIVLPMLYGTSAILIHEVVARRRLGWGNILLLGAAFGIFQEALVDQTWFNYVAKDSPTHMFGAIGVAWGTNWFWGLTLTVYHAVVSIGVPFVLLTALFPQRATQPWLGRKGIVAFSLWLVIPCALLANTFATKQYAAEGYHGPPALAYLAVATLMVGMIVLGVFRRFPAPNPSARPAPRLWTVRLTAFALGTIYFFILNLILPFLAVPAWLLMTLDVALIAVAVWRIRSWSGRTGWDERYLLALAMGEIAYQMFLFGPIVEFGIRLPGRMGLTLVNLVIFILLCLLARSLARRAQANVAPVAAPSHSR